LRRRSFIDIVVVGVAIVAHFDSVTHVDVALLAGSIDPV